MKYYSKEEIKEDQIVVCDPPLITSSLPFEAKPVEKLVFPKGIPWLEAKVQELERKLKEVKLRCAKHVNEKTQLRKKIKRLEAKTKIIKRSLLRNGDWVEPTSNLVPWCRPVMQGFLRDEELTTITLPDFEGAPVSYTKIKSPAVETKFE